MKCAGGTTPAPLIPPKSNENRFLYLYEKKFLALNLLRICDVLPLTRAVIMLVVSYNQT